MNHAVKSVCIIGLHMSNKIIFYPKSKLVKEIVPSPQLVSVPDWFKQLSIYTNGSEHLKLNGGIANYSAKACMPYLDTFRSGYTFNLWCDLQVVWDEEYKTHSVYWGNTDQHLDPLTSRSDAEIPSVPGFDKFVFSWSSHWGVKTPKGYSCLFTHPLNRTDLPFVTTSGIMDTDGWGIWGNQPFAFQLGWSGIIPAGTPIIQIIPFKREIWTSEIDDSLSDWANYESIRRQSKIRGYYKDKYWNRKVYK